MLRCFEGEVAVKYGKDKHKLLNCFANNFLVSKSIQMHGMQGWAARPAGQSAALPKVQMLQAAPFSES